MFLYRKTTGGGLRFSEAGTARVTDSAPATQTDFDGDYDAAEQLAGTVFARSWRTAGSVSSTPLMSSAPGGITPDFQTNAPAGERLQMYIVDTVGSGVGDAGTTTMDPTGPVIWAMYCQYLPAATANEAAYGSQNSKFMRLRPETTDDTGTEGVCTTYGGFGLADDPSGDGEANMGMSCRVGGDSAITGGWNDGVSYSSRYGSYDTGDDFDQQVSGTTQCMRSLRVNQGGPGWTRPPCWIQPVDTWWRVCVHADWSNGPAGDIRVWAQVDGEPWYLMLDGRQSDIYPWYWAPPASARITRAKCFINLSQHSLPNSHPTQVLSFKNFWVGTEQPIAGLP